MRCRRSGWRRWRRGADRPDAGIRRRCGRIRRGRPGRGSSRRRRRWCRRRSGRRRGSRDHRQRGRRAVDHLDHIQRHPARAIPQRHKQPGAVLDASGRRQFVADRERDDDRELRARTATDVRPPAHTPPQRGRCRRNPRLGAGEPRGRRRPRTAVTAVGGIVARRSWRWAGGGRLRLVSPGSSAKHGVNHADHQRPNAARS
jgi:hypothetical protein